MYEVIQAKRSFHSRAAELNYFTTEKCHRVAKYTRQVKKVGKGTHEPKAQTAGAYPGFIT